MVKAFSRVLFFLILMICTTGISSAIDINAFLATPEQTFIEQLLPTLKYIISGLILLAIAIALWLYMLKTEVKRRTKLWVSEFRERQKTQNKLNQKERDYKALVENIQECVFSMTPEGVFTYVSPVSEEITGYTPEEIMHVKYAPFFPDGQENIKRLKKRIETDVDDTAIIQINHKNGSIRWVSASTKIYEHPQHGLSVQGTFRDVTETVRTQKALRYSEERFRKLTEQSPVGIFIVSGDEYVYVNQKYADIFDRDPQSVIGEKINPMLIHEEDRPKLISNHQKLVAAEIEFSDQMHRALKEDGSIRYVHYYTSVIDVDGDRLLFGTALDVTDEMETQNALEEQEERFRTLTDQSFTGLVLVQDGKVLYINPRYCEILGYEKDELKTTDDLFALTHPDDIGRVKQSVEDRKKGIIEYVHYQCRMFHKSGELIYCDIYGSTVTINGKEAIMASVMDITDSVLNQKKLEDSVHEKNVLLAEIHHRVKNNMAVVSGLMELQKFKTKDKTARAILRESQLRVKTIAMIHEKLYQSDSFAKIPFGEYLSDLIAGISDSLYQESSNIKVVEEYDKLLLNINQAIPVALFVNEVITNCFKHAFPGEKTGSVHISIKEEADQWIRLKISDDGVGLSEDYAKTNSLGVTLIKNLSNQVNAELTVDSGNGTSFEIFFKKEDEGSVANKIPR